MKSLLLALAFSASALISTAVPAAAWTITECQNAAGQIDVSIAPDCARFLPPTSPTTTNTNMNTNKQHQNQPQNQAQNQSQTTNVRNAIGIRNNVTNTSASVSSAQGGNAYIAPGAAQGGSVAAGAVQNTNINAPAYITPMVPVQPILAGCDSSAALTAGVSVQAINGGFLSNGTQVGGYVGATIPIGRRARSCYREPVAVAPQQPVVVNVQAAAPAPPAPPQVQYVPQPYAVPQPHLYVVSKPACAPISPERKKALLSKHNRHGIYHLARSNSRIELKSVIDELTRSCVDFSAALDG